MKRAAIIVAILAVVGIVIFIGLGTDIFANLLQRPVNSPAVTNTQEVQNPTQTQNVQSGGDVIAECRLIPVNFVSLAFNTGGLVQEVLVNEGDQVSAGQVLARLSNQELNESSVTQANLELTISQQDLKSLYDNAPLAAAEAYKELILAPENLADAERILRNYQSGAVNVTDIDIAEANLALAENQLRRAEDQYAPYANKPEDNLTRASLLNRLSEAQNDYDRALRDYNALTGGPSNSDLANAEADVALARVKLAEAEKKYEILKDGPDPDDVALAQAQVANAEAQLEAARTSLSNLILVAPFDGTVGNLNIKTGEYIAPGTEVLLLVDFSDWIIETTDLTELNIVRVSEGNQVEIVFDAIPDQQFSGIVERINQVGESVQGEITYKVIIHPELGDDRLLWNMTCSAAIAAGED